MPEPSTAAGAPESGTGASSPRSLAEALRARDDAALSTLLHSRPDLLNPVPGDVTQLATRAGTRASVVRALERLDRFTLQTAEALAVAPDPCPYPVLEGLLTGGEDERARAALPRALGVLRDQALVWGDEDRLRLVRTAREVLAPSAQRPSPTGLGPTVAEATAGMSPTRVQEIVAGGGGPPPPDPATALTGLTARLNQPARVSP
ncbi:DNA-binding protein, partial [Streptomyces yangpuensis]